MIWGIVSWMMKRSAAARRVLSRFWYRWVSQELQDEPVVFMNYGYACLTPDSKPVELREEDAPSRTFAQLYHHIASCIDLRGLEVLEVGCGRGGGASFLMRYHKPKSMLGIDFAQEAIEFCKKHHIMESLRFEQGDAEALPVDDHSADVVINIESSHCYGDMERFISEVYRVLRPGGHLLFADRGDNAWMDGVWQVFLRSGLDIVEEERINENVVRALELESKNRLSQIQRCAPWISRGVAKQFAGVKDSQFYRALASGDMVYMSCVLRKNTIST